MELRSALEKYELELQTPAAKVMGSIWLLCGQAGSRQPTWGTLEVTPTNGGIVCSTMTLFPFLFLRHISLTLPASFRGKSHSSRLDLEHQHSNLYAISGKLAHAVVSLLLSNQKVNQVKAGLFA